MTGSRVEPSSRTSPSIPVTVIPVTVAEHDDLDLGRIDREPPHGLHHPVRAWAFDPRLLAIHDLQPLRDRTAGAADCAGSLVPGSA